MRDTKHREVAVDINETLVFALKLMDSKDTKLLIVKRNGEFNGLLSIGDIQRSIIATGNLDGRVGDAARENVLAACVNDDLEQIKHTMLEKRVEFMPVLDQNRKLVDVIFWDDLFEKESESVGGGLSDIPVVIMAGGQGTRLRPITNIIPKALVPLGDRTALERIIEQFRKSGATEFFVTLNHKGEMIKFYFSELTLDYAISFVKEDLPLGTAGSLWLLRDKIASTFFVSNCDILVEQDMSEVLSFHRSNNNKITIVASIYNHTIPYGTLTTSVGGLLESMQEKPELAYQVNTGIYVLEPEVLQMIAEQEVLHITDLIMRAKAASLRVGVFPVNAGAWMDIGQWNEYRRTAGRFGDSFE